MNVNIFDYFEEVGGGNGHPAPWAARAPRRPQRDYDLKLVPRVGDWRRDPHALAALERVEAQPWVAALARHDEEVRLRLSDAWIEACGAALEAGGGEEAALADLARGRRYAIQFWDANATKALHIGHLRNLALGNSLAAALEQAGGEVERRSVISDAGRSMGEAMAGVVASGHHTAAWPEGDQKSDHFVGLCYADYVAAANFADNGSGAGEDSLTRELHIHDDDADELLKRVLAGEVQALELWFKTRAWVIAGQRKTLSRLGVAFDRVFFESDFLEDGTALTERGLRQGTLTRRGDGVVIYPTGLQEMAEMPLLRADGQSTQHMRAVSYWMGTPDLQGVTTIQICGSEWVAHASAIHSLMSALTPAQNGAASRGVHPTRDIFHGMVAQQKRTVSSSQEGGLLIDDLIEWIERKIDTQEGMRAVRGAHPAPERIPAQIALGYFLPHPVTPDLDFEPHKLFSHRESVGWNLVRARARCGERFTPAGKRPATDRDYRFAVVQSALYRRYLRLAVERLDVRPMAHYIKHLSWWYLERERSSHTERVVHTLLDRAARGLGLQEGR